MERLAGKVILLWGWQRALVALAAGALFGLAQPPFDCFAVGFVSFPLLVWLLDGASSPPGARIVRRLLPGFAVGYWFGLGYFLAGLWWTGNALLVEADLFAWALPLAVFGLPAVLSVFYGLATLIARILWSDGTGRIAALAVGFAVAEWLRSFIFTGFPWNAVGQAAMPVPVAMQSLGVVGMIGMNLMAVLVFSAPALLADRRRGALVPILVVLVAVGGHLGYGALRLAGADRAAKETLLNVRIVQPSIKQTEKWDAAERDRIFATYLDLSRRPPPEGAASPDVIVWPETAVPFVLSERPDALVALGDLLDAGQTLLLGAVRTEAGSSRYYNAVVAVNDQGETYDAVDKVRLVPFGEYLPFADLLSRVGMRQIVQSVAAFSSGSQRHAITVAGGVRALPFLCYEVIFPGIAGYGEVEADILVNATNDAWFGDTPGPYQHFRQAQLRAVEAGRPLVRAANNGISGVVDAYGRVVDAYAIDAVGVLDVPVPRQRLEAPVRPDLAGAGLLLLGAAWATASALRGRRR